MDRFFSPIQQFLITWLLILVSGWLTLNALTYFGELISVLVTAGLIAFLLNYPVARLGKVMPKALAAGVVYLFAGLILTVVAVTIAPPIIQQTQQLTANLPNLIASGQQQLQDFQTWGESRHLGFDLSFLEQQLSVQLQGQAKTIASTGIGLVLNTFNWVLDLILILVISFYLVLDGAKIWGGITGIFSQPIQESLTNSMRDSLQRFASGQLLLGLFMAIALSLAFWWLKVPFFLVFAVFIGVMEVIPFIGASLGIATVGILVAFIDWWMAIEVLGTAIAIQQVKDNAIAPRILGELTGLSPVIILTSLLVGARVAGLLGVILAIPLTSVVKTIVEILMNPDLPPQAGSIFSEAVENSILEPMLSVDPDIEPNVTVIVKDSH
ncbi:putative conserved domain protein [Leptolyngbya boryana NIES-2135]|jgi:predicted PurR-regulated permease PerM|uniref:Putative conserved domain protein n=1 Tax=Leptolyngbya boryana NIES-2135 TaxID=1973484 RepID=A0A1Z4JH35_LEPBY|nr:MULTISPECIES: AI-2E family transporter [Leptolyngbya]BAY56082.1 putative conserved domain protein [Leptolyngbya boryana NIES-2135]MBD2366193.1 AI-2E family transporter [Leptolyngbya sp. FACHB-161]MBD2372373.1 AI-2E family transporter [Leptolyngbya sp. FACHB-238]MBD2396796.1 AI-2E family transporter [Leptolyngbya sp. FACHB-239]MBD2403319.1 AI-2E family transporter [Leptolyngbya sp. FACHB-402]